MSSGWVWPLERLRVTDEFGYRIHPIYGDRRLHRGIDLAASMNQPVFADAVGKVSWAGYNGGEGNSVHIDHPDGSRTKYFHNTSLLVSRGQPVAEGEQIARAGTTGASTGVHVHHETHTSSRVDSPVDPRGFLAERGAPFGTVAAGGEFTPIPNLTPEQIEEAEIMADSAKEAIINSNKYYVEAARDSIIKALEPILKALMNDDEQVERILRAVRIEGKRPRVIQIAPNGRGAAVIETEGYWRTYASAADLDNDRRLSLVSPSTDFVTAEEFETIGARAQARLAELQADPEVPEVSA